MEENRANLHSDVVEIFFPVEKVACRDLFPGFAFVKDKEYVIYLPEKRKILHVCSENYQLVANETLISPIYDQLIKTFGPKGFETRILNFDDRKFYTSFLILEAELSVARSDRIIPSLEIQNSYDGSLKFSLSTGFWRNHTDNPLMGFSREIDGQRKHSNKYNPGLTHEVLTALANAGEEAEVFRQMSRWSLTPGDVNRIAELVRKKTEYPRRLINDGPLAMYQDAQRMDSGPNLWLLYNGFNRVLHHADIQMHREFRERIDVQVVRLLMHELGRI